MEKITVAKGDCIRENRFSDFSIEAILRSTPENPPISRCETVVDDSTEQSFGETLLETSYIVRFQPAYDFSSHHYQWLEYNRLKPPKLQYKRGGRKKSVHRNPRIPFTGCQVSALENKFRQTKYLNSSEVSQMSKKLQISDSRVKIWFQNRRARERRERQSQSFLVEHPFGLRHSFIFNSTAATSLHPSLFY